MLPEINLHQAIELTAFSNPFSSNNTVEDQSHGKSTDQGTNNDSPASDLGEDQYRCSQDDQQFGGLTHRTWDKS